MRRIPKMGRAAVDSNTVFIDDLFVPDEDRIGEEGKGFRYLLDSLNPERMLIGAEAIGLGRDALRRAADYARERVVFGRPIGQNQGIQHPLAEAWAYLESAWWLCLRAASLYDSKQPCGAEANAAKIARRARRFRCLHQSGDDAWRHGLCEGISGGAPVPRVDAPPHRAGDGAAYPVLHRRECSGFAEVVLS